MKTTLCSFAGALALAPAAAITIADTPAEFQAFLKKDYERWARVIKAAGIKSE